MRRVVLPLIFVLALHGALTIHAGARFQSALDDLHAAGEPCSLAGLGQLALREEKSGALLLAEAARWYESNLRSGESTYLMGHQWEDTDPYSTNYQANVGPGRKLRVEWLELKQEDLRGIRSWLRRGQPYLDLLVRAAACSRIMHAVNWEDGLDARDPTGLQLLTARRFLFERAIRAGQTTRSEYLVLATMLDLSYKFECQFWGQLRMRWDLVEHACNGLEVLSKKPGFSAVAARRTLDFRLLRAADSTELVDAVRGERAAGLFVVGRWIAGESPHRTFGQAAESSDDTSAELDRLFRSDSIWGSWALRALAYRDGLRLLDVMDAVATVASASPETAVAAAMEVERRHPQGVTTVVSGAFATALTSTTRDYIKHVAEVRVARVALAILEAKEATGSWPSSLEPVMDRVGKQAVVDPYTGAHLEYVPGKRLEAMVPFPDSMPRGSDEAWLVSWMFEVVWRFS